MGSRILIIANKWWEAAPLVAVFQHAGAGRSRQSAVPESLLNASQWVVGGSSSLAPRLAVRCGEIGIEIWCIQDLMDVDENSSLTWEKARVLPRLARRAGEIKVVIGFGTAASVDAGINGSVVIGTKVFAHDPYSVPPTPAKHWSDQRLEQLVASDAQDLLGHLPCAFVPKATRGFLSTPNQPAQVPQIRIGNDKVSVGVVNVINSADYSWTDKQALDKFTKVTGVASAGSVETTHAVIRLVLDLPFIFVSGIANALGRFESEVGPNPYSQNFAAAHNAAITVAWMIPEIVSELTKG